MNDHVNETMAGILNTVGPKENAPPSVPVQAVVRPWCEPTSRGYDVSGPDKDGDMCIEFDVDTNIIWLARRDVEMLLARWPNVQVEFQEGSE